MPNSEDLRIQLD